VKNEAQFGGVDCEGVNQHAEMCESWTCPVDCRWTVWGAWMPCTKTCGSGNMHRSRAYDPRPESGGTPCAGAHMEMIDCGSTPCPVDCMWDEWMDWSLCSSSCGKTGRRAKIRLVLIAESHGGAECGGSVLEEHDWHQAGGRHTIKEEECADLGECPVDCRFSTWGEWLPCNATCDEEGHRNANRTLLLAGNGGSPICPEGPLNMAMECTGKICGEGEGNVTQNGAPRLQLVASSLIWVALFLLDFL